MLPVRSDQLVDGEREPQPGEAFEEGGEGLRGMDAGDRGSRAEVAARPEGQVRVRRAVEIEPLGVRELFGVEVRALDALTPRSVRVCGSL